MFQHLKKYPSAFALSPRYFLEDIKWLRSKKILNARNQLLTILASPRVEEGLLEEYFAVTKKSVKAARERWFKFEDSGDTDDLVKLASYARADRYPKDVTKLIVHLATNIYGYPHPSVTVGNPPKPRIDLRYNARQLARLMLDEHRSKFITAMNKVTWNGPDGTEHHVPHHTFIENIIRARKYFHFNLYHGEYFSCVHCLEKEKSFKGVVDVLRELHKQWSPQCPNAACECGAYQANRQHTGRVLRSATTAHKEHCTRACVCDSCSELFAQFISFRRFLYKLIESRGCRFVDDQPLLTCREQTCGQCKLSELMKLANIADVLGLPFAVPADTPTRTYLTSPVARTVERIGEKSRTFASKETAMARVTFKQAWDILFHTAHPKRKKPFAQAFLKHRAEDQWFKHVFQKLTDRTNPLLPVGTLIIMNDFSQSPKFQIAQEVKSSNQVFTQQQFLLGPTPCIFVVEEEGKLDIKLVVLHMIAEDSKHSSPRVSQIFSVALDYMETYMEAGWGTFGSSSTISNIRIWN